MVCVICAFSWCGVSFLAACSVEDAWPASSHASQVGTEAQDSRTMCATTRPFKGNPAGRFQASGAGALCELGASLGLFDGSGACFRALYLGWVREPNKCYTCCPLAPSFFRVLGPSGRCCGSETSLRAPRLWEVVGHDCGFGRGPRGGQRRGFSPGLSCSLGFDPMVQNQWYHFGIGAPPILVYFSGDWDVHWGYGVLTHGHLIPWKHASGLPPRFLIKRRPSPCPSGRGEEPQRRAQATRVQALSQKT